MRRGTVREHGIIKAMCRALVEDIHAPLDKLQVSAAAAEVRRDDLAIQLKLCE
jgi:hypothetical protein